MIVVGRVDAIGSQKTKPGRLNRERWAGKRLGQKPKYDYEVTSTKAGVTVRRSDGKTLDGNRLIKRKITPKEVRRERLRQRIKNSKSGYQGRGDH